MRTVTRVARTTPAELATDDGYVYRWTSSDPIDVLPQHLMAILALPGATAVEVEVVDEPVILPVIRERTPMPAATVASATPTAAPLHIGDSGPAATVAAEPRTDPPASATPRVTHYWSDADKAQLEQHRPDLRTTDADEPVQRP